MTHVAVEPRPQRRRDPDAAPPERNALRRRHDRAIARLGLERDALRATIGRIENVTEGIDKRENDGSAEAGAALRERAAPRGGRRAARRRITSR
jgi:hypothetical protein